MKLLSILRNLIIIVQSKQKIFYGTIKNKFCLKYQNFYLRFLKGNFTSQLRQKIKQVNHLLWIFLRIKFLQIL